MQQQWSRKERHVQHRIHNVQEAAGHEKWNGMNDLRQEASSKQPGRGHTGAYSGRQFMVCKHSASDGQTHRTDRRNTHLVNWEKTTDLTGRVCAPAAAAAAAAAAASCFKRSMRAATLALPAAAPAVAAALLVDAVPLGEASWVGSGSSGGSSTRSRSAWGQQDELSKHAV